MFDRKIFTLKFFKVDLWAFWSQWSSWSCCVYNVWLWLSITLQLCCDALFDPKCNHFRCLHTPVKCACNYCKWMLNGYPNGTATLHGSATRPTRLSHLCQGHMCYTVREGLMYVSLRPQIRVWLHLCWCQGVHVSLCVRVWRACVQHTQPSGGKWAEAIPGASEECRWSRSGVGCRVLAPLHPRFGG